jgi:GTP-dependent dephospho-CoA kinase
MSELRPRKVRGRSPLSRENLVAGISVDLIIDHISMRKPSASFNIEAGRTYRVKNPAGVITEESWNAIKRTMKERDVLIVVEGEEDLLALPCTVESPNEALVFYGQPDRDLIVVETGRDAKNEASLILGRMTMEEAS